MMSYKMFATWTLISLKSDLRKPGFYLLRTFGKGEGNRTRPQNSGWMIKATDKKILSRDKTLRRCLHIQHTKDLKVPCSMEEARTELARFCSPGKATATSCLILSVHEESPCLTSAILGYKKSSWEPGIVVLGKMDPPWKLVLSPFSPLPKSESVPEYQKASRNCCILVGWGISKRGDPPWPRERGTLSASYFSLFSLFI